MQDLDDPWQRQHEDVRDFDASEIACRKDEYPGFAGSQRGDLKRTVPKPLILGEHNPTPLSNVSQPDAIFLVTGEVVVMKFDKETGVDECRPDRSCAQ